MADFNKHFRMKVEDVVLYAREKLDIFSEDADLKAKEIGDGNINYVFKVWDEKTGQSVVIKQADTLLRSSGRPLDTDRNRIEAEALMLQSKLAPSFVPKVYKYDPIMCALTMEDISDHYNLRYELLKRKKFPKFADHITSFMVNTLLLTTDLVLDPAEKKRKVKNFINVELCDISEKLVFTEPYNDYLGRNIILRENINFVQKIVYEDKRLALEASKLKNNFINNAQSLIHGDLHSGSIFVNEESTKIIDPEFAFYGPMGYDVGNVVGNLFFSWVNAYVTMDEEEKREDFLSYLEGTIEDVVDLFTHKFKKMYKESVTDVLAKSPAYMDWYLNTVLTDTCGVSGLEIMRRTVGDSKVVDITGIEDLQQRIKAERILILLAKYLILNRNHIRQGKDYIDALQVALQEYNYHK